MRKGLAVLALSVMAVGILAGCKKDDHGIFPSLGDNGPCVPPPGKRDCD